MSSAKRLEVAGKHEAPMGRRDRIGAARLRARFCPCGLGSFAVGPSRHREDGVAVLALAASRRTERN